MSPQSRPYTLKVGPLTHVSYSQNICISLVYNYSVTKYICSENDSTLKH